MRKKGFTLIELLAIIVILTIIALIAVPMITGIIENSRKSSVELSAKAYISAVEDCVVISKADVPIEDGTYGIEELTEFGVSVKGNAPIDGTVQIENGKVIYYRLVIDKYVVENGNTTLLTYKNIGDIYNDIIDSGVETYNYMDGTYFSGNVTNNYVWYNGFIWRIMGKNADGSIRLITEENVTAIPWGEEGSTGEPQAAYNNTALVIPLIAYNTSQGVTLVADNSAQDYDNSYVKDWVNNYFLPKLKDTSKIVSTTFCEDSTLITDETSSRATCSNPVSAMAGILSFDEYNLAGGSSSYLVNSQDYWTLTPYNVVSAWYVNDDGSADLDRVMYANGVRPVISIFSDTTITGGNGTLTANSDTEYVLGQTLANVTGTLSSKSASGEYVKFDGRLYRIVEHTEEGTKLILDGTYDMVWMTYGRDFSIVGARLTSSGFINWLVPTRQDDILDTTWYRGDYFYYGEDYKTNLASTDNPFTNKVGLIRVGEMLSGQSLSIISSNYSVANSASNANNYWTLTPSSTVSAWSVWPYCSAASTSATNSYGVIRPVIMLSSDMNITTGNGTLSRPYEV